MRQPLPNLKRPARTAPRPIAMAINPSAPQVRVGIALHVALALPTLRRLPSGNAILQPRAPSAITNLGFRAATAKSALLDSTQTGSVRRLHPSAADTVVPTPIRLPR